MWLGTGTWTGDKYGQTALHPTSPPVFSLEIGHCDVHKEGLTSTKTAPALCVPSSLRTFSSVGHRKRNCMPAPLDRQTCILLVYISVVKLGILGPTTHVGIGDGTFGGVLVATDPDSWLPSTSRTSEQILPQRIRRPAFASLGAKRVRKFGVARQGLKSNRYYTVFPRPCHGDISYRTPRLYTSARTSRSPSS